MIPMSLLCHIISCNFMSQDVLSHDYHGIPTSDFKAGHFIVTLLTDDLYKMIAIFNYIFKPDVHLIY